MKKILITLFFLLSIIQLTNITFADSCVLGDGDVIFSAGNSNIRGLNVKLKIKTSKCLNKKITIALYEYDKCVTGWFGDCDDSITFSSSRLNEQDSITIQTKETGDNIILDFTASEDDCESSDLPNCLIYVEIKEGGKLIYSSREKIIDIAQELSKIENGDIAQQVNQILSSKNQDGLLLKNCDEAFGWLGSFFTDNKSCSLSDNDWGLNNIYGGNEIDEKGNVIENNNSNPQSVNLTQQYINPNSLCLDDTGSKYNPDCYELLAPIPGFISEYPDPNDPNKKLSNIKNENGRIAIKDLNKLNVGDLINSLFQVSLGILMVLAVVMIVIAGVEYMTTESLYGKGQARQRITGALTGLILSLGIFLILRTINPNLLEVNFQKNIKSVTLKKLDDPADQDVDITSITSTPNSQICKNRKDRGKITNQSQKETLVKEISNKKDTFLGQHNIKKRSSTVGDYVEKNFASRLRSFYTDLNQQNISTVVTEAFPPTSYAHKSPCHYKASCIDLATENKNYSNEIIGTIIKTADRNGLTAQFEGGKSQVSSARDANKDIDGCMMLYVSHSTGAHFSIYDKSTN